MRNKSHYVQTRVRLHLRQRATCTNTGPLHRSAVMSYQLHNVVRCSPTVIENAIAKVRHCESPPRDGLTKLGKSVAKASLENPRCEKHYACNNAEFNPVVIDAQFMIAAIILRDTYQLIGQLQLQEHLYSTNCNTVTPSTDSSHPALSDSAQR